MNLISTLGSLLRAPGASPQWPTQGRNATPSRAAPASAPGGNPLPSPAAGQASGGAPALLQRAADLGSAALQAATGFLGNVAQSLFGDAAKGMSIAFDSSSVSASSSFAALVQHSEGANGGSDSTALGLRDSADFTGKGTITTADGQRFSFEIQLHYESTLQMSANSTSTGDAAPAPDPQLPTGSRDGLDIRFPGSTADLFSLLDQGALRLSLHGATGGPSNDTTKLGGLKLNLLDLIPHPDPAGRQLARAYGGLPASDKLTAQA